MWPTVKDDWRGVERCLIIDPAVSWLRQKCYWGFHITGYLQDKRGYVPLTYYCWLCLRVCVQFVVHLRTRGETCCVRLLPAQWEPAGWLLCCVLASVTNTDDWVPPARSSWAGQTDREVFLVLVNSPLCLRPSVILCCCRHYTSSKSMQAIVCACACMFACVSLLT